MINVVDRVPTEVLSNGAVRWEQFDSSGNSLGYVYLKKADEPAVVGTPIDKALFDSIKDDLEHEKYAIGTYTGDGVSTGKIISLSFTPRAVVVQAAEPHNNAEYYGRYLGIGFTGHPYSTEGSSAVNLIEIVENGFKIKSSNNIGFNTNGKIYDYIAIE